MRKSNIFILYTIALLQGMVFYAPIATLYRTSQGLTISQVTFIESIFLVLSFLFEIPWGVLADRIGYKHTMLVCNSLYFVSKLVFWQAHSFAAFLAERILLAVIITGLSGVDISMLYLSCTEAESHRVFSRYNAMQTVGLLAASLICSRCVGSNFQTAGFLTVLSYGAAMILTFFLTEVRDNEPRRPERAFMFAVFRDTVSHPALLLFLLASALLAQTHQTITVFLGQLQYEKLGMATADMSGVYILVSLAGLLGVFSPKLTMLVGTHTALQLCCALAALSCLTLALSKTTWPCVAAVILFQIAFHLADPLKTQLQNKQIITTDRATALSVHTIFMDTAGAGVSIVLGTTAEAHLSCAFLLGAAFCIIAGILLAIFVKKTDSFPA